MNSSSLHKVESLILYTLRRSETARFSDLMRPTGLESDAFKFHIRKLVKSGYVIKLAEGSYQLTPSGKEFANNLDKTSRAIQKQPKLSLLLVVSRQNQDNETEYLFQKRLRHPFYGYWGCLSGPARWGEELEVSAAQELMKQTGLVASFTVRSFLRTRDYNADSDTLLEDKLFAVLESIIDDSKAPLTNSWGGGLNAWMTISELKNQEHCFRATEDTLAMLQRHTTYESTKQIYNSEQY
jgi:ADP-ribose pyrophosphatase YjhB (NUDIX family)/predicted transcriptional regulator